MSQQNLDWIRLILESTPKRWMDLSKGIDLELAWMSPAPGEWSAAECLLHLIDTERWIFPFRVRAILTGQKFPGFDPDTEGSRADKKIPLSKLAEEFANLRTEGLEALSLVSPEDFTKVGQHAVLGEVQLGHLINEWAAHDLIHTVQGERAIAQPFIRQSGPWIIYFEKDIIKPS